LTQSGGPTPIRPIRKDSCTYVRTRLLNGAKGKGETIGLMLNDEHFKRPTEAERYWEPAPPGELGRAAVALTTLHMVGTLMHPDN